MIEYNNTDEFNSIETGNTVYISGLPGKPYSYVNNKHGRVKDIYLTCENGRISYTAKVQLYSDNEEYFVNFDYLFKVGTKMNYADIKSLIWEENPFNHYVIKKELVECHPMQDENGQLLAVCSDRQKRKHVFLYSGIN
jgi:hypothetical protein